MSEYTPTTEEIRRAVTSFNEYFDHPRAAEFDGDLFDRWLAEVKAQGRKAERERTIGLLMANELDRTILTAIVDLIEGEEQ